MLFKVSSNQNDSVINSQYFFREKKKKKVKSLHFSGEKKIAKEGPSGGKMSNYRFGSVRHSGQNKRLEMITFSMPAFGISKPHWRWQSSSGLRKTKGQLKLFCLPHLWTASSASNCQYPKYLFPMQVFRNIKLKGKFWHKHTKRMRICMCMMVQVMRHNS